MIMGSGLDRCFAYVRSHTAPAAQRHPPHAPPRPSVTISRQSGSGAMAIANKLADFLQTRDPAPGGWTVFDKNLVEKVLEEHSLPKEVARFMPEDRVSAIQDMMEELLGLHPASWTLLRETTETILHLATLGNVILVGRGSSVITRQLNNVFHVRLIAPLEKRVEVVMKRSHLTRMAALASIEKEDRGRERYLKRYFKADIDDRLLYDLVINTARIPPDTAAQLIGEVVLRWAKTL